MTYRYIQTYIRIHTYIHKYSDFLVVLISVGLAQARPNHDVYCIPDSEVAPVQSSSDGDGLQLPSAWHTVVSSAWDASHWIVILVPSG